MNMIAKPIFTTALVLTLGMGAASAVSAKGHNQGFGNGTAGPDTAGLVDDTQSNRDGRSAETSYGLTDAVLEAQDGIPGNSVAAQERGMDHPSMNGGNGR